MGTGALRGATWLVSVPLLLAALAGCAGTASDPAQEVSPTSSATASPGGKILRLGDDGAEVALQVGETAVVFLPASYTWEEPVVDGDAVTISQDISDEGSPSRSWTVTAQRAGTANVTLTGSPTCRSETPSCAAPDVVWSAAFAVR